MQLEERPGPPGPYAAPDEIAPPRPDVSTGGTRYADIEYARVMGFRPLRMDVLLPPAPAARYRWSCGSTAAPFSSARDSTAR